MLKKELYLSTSLLVMAFALTGCGDTGTSSSSLALVQNQAPSSDPEKPLDLPLKTLEEYVAHAGETVDDTLEEMKADLSPPLSPSSAASFPEMDKAIKAQNEVDETIRSIRAAYSELGEAAKNLKERKGTLATMEDARASLISRIGEFQIALIKCHAVTGDFVRTEEYEKLAAAEKEKFNVSNRKILSLASEIEGKIPLKGIDSVIDNAYGELGILGKDGESGLFVGTNFGDSLRQKIEKVNSLKLDKKLPGDHSVRFISLDENKEPAPDKVRSRLIQNLFLTHAMLEMVVKGEVDDATGKVYKDVVFPNLAMEFVYEVSATLDLFNKKMYYTFPEIRKIINLAQGKTKDERVALADGKPRDDLGGKPYPVFDEKPGKDRQLPTVEQIGELEAEVETKVKAIIRDYLLTNPTSKQFFPLPDAKDAALALSSGSIKDLSGDVSFRDARTSSTGRIDGRSLSMNGISGQAVDLRIPLFVQLKGDVNGGKATEAATGSVAYRLGNTVIGAIQGYANSGAGFGFEGRQLESSVVASHSFGGLFIEGQAGSVAADNVHGSDWNGYRSQLTLGFDVAYVTPFIQVSHRQLDRNGIHQLNETVGYVGLDVDVANLAADTYSVNTRLLAKVGYGEQAWSQGSKDLGSTSGVRSSVEWTAGVNLNSGISFSTNLGLDTLSGSSAGLKVSLDR